MSTTNRALLLAQTVGADIKTLFTSKANKNSLADTAPGIPVTVYKNETAGTWPGVPTGIPTGSPVIWVGTDPAPSGMRDGDFRFKAIAP